MPLEELLVQGAKVNLRTPKDDTALHFAAGCRHQVEACKLLIRHGGGPGTWFLVVVKIYS